MASILGRRRRQGLSIRRPPKRRVCRAAAPNRRTISNEDISMKLRSLALAGMALWVVGPAAAHHSFAMFEREKFANVSGVVKEYEWTNPHVWIHIMVPNAQGKDVEWSFEMQSIAQDSRAGWRPDSVKPGDKVTVEYHPLKDGSRGGQ